MPPVPNLIADPPEAVVSFIRVAGAVRVPDSASEATNGPAARLAIIKLIPETTAIPITSRRMARDLVFAVFFVIRLHTILLKFKSVICGCQLSYAKAYDMLRITGFDWRIP